MACTLEPRTNVRDRTPIRFLGICIGLRRPELLGIMYASVSTLYYIGTSYEISDFDYQ